MTIDPSKDALQAPSGFNVLEMFKYMKYLPLLMKAFEVVAAVEALRGPGGGAEKKVEAMKGLAAAWAIVEGVSGKDLLDDAAFLALADQLIEIAVVLLNMQPRFEEIAGKIRALKPGVPS